MDPSSKNIMENTNARIDDEVLEKAAGGASAWEGGVKTVTGIPGSGYLPLRTTPELNTMNEKKGFELHNGDQVEVLDRPVIKSDGNAYVLVHSLRSDGYGFVNARYLD